MKTKNYVLLALGIILCIITLIIIMNCTKDYRISKDNSYIPYFGAVDIYNASREELLELDMFNYSNSFGAVETEKEAYKIASKIIEEVYGNDESPYIIKFNQKANAWIVSGSLSLFQFGGVSSVAIDKETGEILMLIHTK